VCNACRRRVAVAGHCQTCKSLPGIQPATDKRRDLFNICSSVHTDRCIGLSQIFAHTVSHRTLLSTNPRASRIKQALAPSHSFILPDVWHSRLDLRTRLSIRHFTRLHELNLYTPQYKVIIMLRSSRDCTSDASRWLKSTRSELFSKYY
jgi:hypothetical protein